MPAVRAFAALVLLGFTATWLTQAPTTAPRTPPPLVVRVPATTSTTLAPTTTTSTTVVQRASRAATRPRPAPIIAAAVAPAVVVDGCEGWAPKSREQSDACWTPFVLQWSDWSLRWALNVIWCESKGNPYAVNGSHAGLFQIRGATPGLIGPHFQLAHDIWSDHGPDRWTCRG